MPRDMVYAAALEAMKANDGPEMEKVMDAKLAAVQVKDSMFGGVAIPEGLKFKDGDTLLHLAMRNQKWPIRQVLVVGGANATTLNKSGESPAGMQVSVSLPRTGSVALSFGVLMLSGFEVGTPTLVVFFGLLMMSIGDLILAVRWWMLSNYSNYSTRVKANKAAAAAGHEKTKTKGSAKKKR